MSELVPIAHQLSELRSQLYSTQLCYYELPVNFAVSQRIESTLILLHRYRTWVQVSWRAIGIGVMC